ncbi:probably inactive leucine-rich repeat receptor-like protein kinase At5g06940 [Aristolochia californica]|uniref:probably inactive leucine-rich repeat receptor-like protein kinase At5g06940 n=1 Tax=Aristolochia californica TaxID=171875 RepID=UPI0035D7F3A1
MASVFSSLSLSLGLFFSLVTLVVSVSERDLLLAFRASIIDPKSSLSSWSNASATHFCDWTGVTCNSESATSVVALDLKSLNLSGKISSSICQLPFLSRLSLANNFFNQPIPLHLAQCKSLQALNLSSNLLWGTIPDQLSLLTSLSELDLSKNLLQGQISSGLSSLNKLQVLNLGRNWFSGIVPSSVFGNLTELILLDLSENPSLTSEIPEEIGKLTKLQKLFLQNSGFIGGIPDSFVSLRGLVILDLSQNNLTGNVPLGLGSGLEKIIYFDISQNKLSGFFPTGICNGQGLTELSLHTNSFSGLIPDSLQNCVNLERFQVQNNEFVGTFPTGIWSLPKIKLIRAESNKFSGEIPSSVSLAPQLEQLQIDNNSFIGKIPFTLGEITTMYRFSASLNGFYGELPDNFCNSPVMSIINLSHNSLSGPIPELRKCRKLVSISLAENSFSGKIPSSLAELPVLTYIDLSSNNLTGEIPQGLQNLKLALFNVSFNRLSGAVPLSLISGLPASFLQGNPDLCGPGLPSLCADERPKTKPARPTGLICALIATALAAGILVVGAVFFVFYRSSRRKSFPGSLKWVFFYPLTVTEQDLVKVLEEKNSIAQRACGKVHVVPLPTGEFVAVKKLIHAGSVSSKALRTEIKTLAKVRHKNVVKLMGFCYSHDFVVLIYEYLPKGSLGDLIKKPGFSLDWEIRLKIAVGIARGLAYLHKDYVPHLLHRNMKARNVLLDMDFEAKLTDFGFDRIVGEVALLASMASESGAHCYLAPELACSKKATEQMDVYSFGVVLLELITGRAADRPDCDKPMDIAKWVRSKINIDNGFVQILDPKISNSSQENMLEALQIALRCISVMPEKRPTIYEVIRSLQSIETGTRSLRICFGDCPPSY